MFDKEVKFKMFDQNGEWVIYDLKNKLRFGGKSGYTPGEVYEKIGGSGFEPQLVQYKLDTEDKIKEVNVAVVTSQVRESMNSAERPMKKIGISCKAIRLKIRCL